MRPKQSQEKYGSSSRLAGTLFIVGVPIGHPDDLTIRALAGLRSVHLIVTKSPSATQALLAHHGVRTALTTYDRVNAAEKTPVLLARLKHGTHIALVSDCGMPVIYDPGRILINAATAAHIPIEVIPGPSAVATAAAIAGMDGNAFVFEGRCTGSSRDLARRLDLLKTERRTLIFFPPARALRRILTLVLRIFGNRHVVVAIDLTHQTERIVRGRVQDVLTSDPFQDGILQVTLVVEGRQTGERRHRA
ncbi:MAG TPA: SAM-dependent methyltransferase [Nitrospira sp.]|nr:SAM-dependent methyltransferase [Nitrospira sp.]